MMRSKRLLLASVLVLLTWLLTPLIAQATTRYVSPSGSGSTCSKASPCSLDTGISQTGAGDTLYLKGGTYTQRLEDQTPTLPSGTSWDNPVTIAGAPGETAVFTRGMNMNPGKQYIIFRDFIMDGGRTYDDDGVGGNGVYAYIRWQNLEIANFLRSGIFTANDAHHLELLNCDSHHNGSSPSYHGGYWSAQDSLIEGNQFHDNASLGIQIQEASGTLGSNNNIFRNNRIYGNPEQGLHVDGQDNLIYNNVIYNNGSGVTTFNGSFGSDRNKFYSNTVYGNTGEAFYIAVFGPSADTDIQNNIMFGNGVDGVVLGSEAINTTILYNLCSSSGPNCSGPTNVHGDPGFRSAPDADFHIDSASSPVVNAGATLGAPFDVDIEGLSRPAGQYTIGAYQCSRRGQSRRCRSF
jgi:parallel beta-helix repeat protein